MCIFWRKTSAKKSPGESLMEIWWKFHWKFHWPYESFIETFTETFRWYMKLSRNFHFIYETFMKVSLHAWNFETFTTCMTLSWTFQMWTESFNYFSLKLSCSHWKFQWNFQQTFSKLWQRRFFNQTSPWRNVCVLFQHISKTDGP